MRVDRLPPVWATTRVCSESLSCPAFERLKNGLGHLVGGTACVTITTCVGSEIAERADDIREMYDLVVAHGNSN